MIFNLLAHGFNGYYVQFFMIVIIQAAEQI